jgi:hypothetical protein
MSNPGLIRLRQQGTSIYFSSQIFGRRPKIWEEKKEKYRCESALSGNQVVLTTT